MRPWFQRTLWGVLGLAVALGLLMDWWPRAEVGSRLDQLPLNGFGIAGRDLPLNPHEAAVFGRTRVLKRLYQAGGERFVLLAVDSGGDRHAVHDPLYCFHGAGWTVIGDATATVPGGQARLVRLTKRSQTAEAMYWFTDGRKRHASALRVWWDHVLGRLGMKSAAARPVLVLLQPLTGQTANWRELPGRFPQLFQL